MVGIGFAAGRGTRSEASGDIVEHLQGAGVRGALVEGEAGIGKTTLLRAVIAELSDRGIRTLTTAATEPDQSAAYAGLVDLLDDVVAEHHLAELAAPRRHALETVLLRAEPTTPIDARAVGVAVGDVVRRLATDGRLVLVVDDLHWCDPATCTAIRIALRRCQESAVGLLAAWRSEAGGDQEQVLGSIPVDRLLRCRLRGLSVGETAAVVEGRLGRRLPRSQRVLLHEASAGHPLLAIELARALVEDDATLRPGAPLPVPADLDALFARRLRRLGPAARHALDVVAVGGRVEEQALLGADSTRELESGIDEAYGAGLLDRGAGVLRVGHPVLGPVVLARLDPRATRAAHRVLAAAATDPVQRARHRALARSAASARAAAELDRAATLVSERGDPRQCALLSELAAELTPAADRVERVGRTLRAARARFESGELDLAVRLAHRALEEAPDASDRAEALLLLAELAVSGGDRAEAERLARAAQAAAAGDAVAIARVELALSQWADDDVAVEVAHARSALQALAGCEDAAPGLVARAVAAIAYGEFLAGNGLDDDAMQRAVGLTEPTPRTTIFGNPIDAYTQLLGCVGRIDEARGWLDRLVEWAAEAGVEPARPVLAARACMLDLAAGDLHAASGDVDSALVVADELDLDLVALWSYRWLVDALTGSEVAARRAATEAHRVAIGRGDDWSAALFARAAGAAALVAGDAEGAVPLLRDTLRIGRRFGVTEPSWFRVHGDLVEALVRSGATAEAAVLVGDLEASAERTAIPWTCAMALRGRALVHAAAGDLEAAADAAARSVAAADVGAGPYEWARSALVAGVVERRRRRKRTARDLLGAAADVFDRIGAVTWAVQARTEFDRVGGRRPAADGLSASERRVAELAAAGRTNREIADALFLSVRTVESHLSVAYRKLSVRSRTELARVLAGAP